MTACTFDNTTVDSIEVTRMVQLGTTTCYKFECTIQCQSDSSGNYYALLGKAGIVNKTTLYNGKTSIQTVGGTKGTLVLNNITYTNCYIESLTLSESPWSNLAVWKYSISFVMDTSGA